MSLLFFLKCKIIILRCREDAETRPPEEETKTKKEFKKKQLRVWVQTLSAYKRRENINKPNEIEQSHQDFVWN